MNSAALWAWAMAPGPMSGLDSVAATRSLSAPTARPLFMDGVIAAMIGGLRSARPKLRVVQTHGYAQKLIERLSNGTLDFAVRPLRADAAPKPLTFRRILPGVNVIACRVKRPLTRRSAVKPSDLARNPGSPCHWTARPTWICAVPCGARAKMTSGPALLADLRPRWSASCRASTFRRPCPIPSFSCFESGTPRTSAVAGDRPSGPWVRPASRNHRVHDARGAPQSELISTQFGVFSQPNVRHRQRVLWRGLPTPCALQPRLQCIFDATEERPDAAANPPGGSDARHPIRRD